MKKIFMPVFIMLMLFACKKKTVDAPPAQTKENISGQYKLTALTAKTATTGETDILVTYVTACRRDDIQQFKADLTYNYIDAGTKCSPAGDDNGAWSLPAPGKMLIDGVNFDIISFTGPMLVLSNVDVLLGTSTTFKTTLTKQ